MSKGNDVFYYGDKTSPIKYDKKQIVQFTTIRNKSYKSPISGFAIVEIRLKDDTVIKIPSLLINYSSLEHKLFAYTKIEKNSFPFLRS